MKVIKISIGNCTNIRKCKVCKKPTGDYIRKESKEIPCHFQCYPELKKENKSLGGTVI